jgi:hypothetical protein
VVSERNFTVSFLDRGIVGCGVEIEEAVVVGHWRRHAGLEARWNATDVGVNILSGAEARLRRLRSRVGTCGESEGEEFA